MTTRTQHTILVKVSSHKSGGRAKQIAGNLCISKGFSDPALTSNYFLRHEIGTILVVKVRLSGKRRLIQYVKLDAEVSSIGEFNAVYGEIMEREDSRYERLTGEVADRDVEVPTWLDDQPVVTADDLAPLVEADPVDWTTKIYVDPKDEKLLDTVRKLSDNRHIAIMMIGPSGYGKTSVPQQKADDWGMTFLRQDCATVRDPEEFFGFRGAVDGSTMTDDGETFFAESEFTKTIEAGNCVVVLDELNRIDPYISNILFPLLDHAGKTNVAGHEIKVGQNVIFFATVNLGFQFTGTFTLDTALTNRFAAKVLVNSLPNEVEENILKARGGVNTPQAKQIVKLMEGLRQLNEKGSLSTDASTRVSIQIAEFVGAGMNLREALVYVVINGISEEEAKMVIDQLGYIS